MKIVRTSKKNGKVNICIIEELDNGRYKVQIDQNGQGAILREVCKTPLELGDYLDKEFYLEGEDFMTGLYKEMGYDRD